MQIIHEISEENGGVIISFPRSGASSDKVVLKGAPQCIEGAKARIQEIIEDLVSGCGHDICIEGARVQRLLRTW